MTAVVMHSTGWSHPVLKRTPEDIVRATMALKKEIADREDPDPDADVDAGGSPLASDIRDWQRDNEMSIPMDAFEEPMNG